jgi:hypothetical protein
VLVAVMEPEGINCPMHTHPNRGAFPLLTRFVTRTNLPRSTLVINDLWYKNAVIYSLSVETFMVSWTPTATASAIFKDY